MSGKDLLRSMNEALAEQGERFNVQRGAGSHVVAGKRASERNQIWFAGDADIQIGDVIISTANGNEFVVIDIKPRVAMNVQYQVFASVESRAEHQARIAREEDEKTAQIQRASEAEFEPVRTIILDQRQQNLLTQMVDASRTSDQAEREPFMFLSLSEGDTLLHRGLPNDGAVEVIPADLRTLEREGLLDADERTNQTNYTITPRGYLYYRYMMTRHGAPVDRVTSAVHRYLEADVFRQRYPEAYAKWARAESELWSADSEQGVTAVGHLCREATQEFAHGLVVRYNPPDTSQSPTDKAQTVKRVRAVLNQAALGSTEGPFLDALLAYWGTLSDLVQRQEHGGQKEGSPVTWQDGRRVVFHTAITMFEIDYALNRPSPE